MLTTESRVLSGRESVISEEKNTEKDYVQNVQGNLKKKKKKQTKKQIYKVREKSKTN